MVFAVQQALHVPSQQVASSTLAPGTHLELLVIIAVVNHHEAQIETPSQIKEVVCLSFGPRIIMEIHLVFLLRVDRYLHCLCREN